VLLEVLLNLAKLLALVELEEHGLAHPQAWNARVSGVLLDLDIPEPVVALRIKQIKYFLELVQAQSAIFGLALFGILGLELLVGLRAIGLRAQKLVLLALRRHTRVLGRNVLHNPVVLRLDDFVGDFLVPIRNYRHFQVELGEQGLGQGSS